MTKNQKINIILQIPQMFYGRGEVKDVLFELSCYSEKAYTYYRNDGYYEVFLRKSTPKCIDFEKRIYSETENVERYPKAKDFGSWAWCYNDPKKAMEKFKELSK